MSKAEKQQDWSLAKIWNEVALKPDRPLVKRDYVYASEIGGPMIDRFLKMKAVPYTNPPNDRSRRKFLCGNLFEYMVKQILIASGVYERDEVKCDTEPYKDTLGVHGRMDFKTIEGYIDVARAFDRLNTLSLPAETLPIGKAIIESLDGVNLKGKILELKSVSSFAMDRVEAMHKPIGHHTLQAFHYQRGAGMPAEICYCCRDDLRMQQFKVKEEESEPLYRKDLVTITEYFRKNKKPPLELPIKFDPILCKFSKNFGIEWSPYLTILYGFATPEEYRNSVNHVEKWNRVLARYALAETGGQTATGKKIEITAKNKEIRVEIEKAGHLFKDMLELKIKTGAIEELESE